MHLIIESIISKMYSYAPFMKNSSYNLKKQCIHILATVFNVCWNIELILQAICLTFILKWTSVVLNFRHTTTYMQKRNSCSSECSRCHSCNATRPRVANAKQLGCDNRTSGRQRASQTKLYYESSIVRSVRVFNTEDAS